MPARPVVGKGARGAAVKYLSVCSGVEAASVAWHRLGWQAVGFSEIESFPAAVLAHHYPTVPNFGDLTKHETWNLAPGTVDLLVGGTPCQAFSVAGKRAGLDDPRGQLMLAYLDLAGRLRPQWIVWENVPGVLSSNGGRDFGAFLGGLEHLGYGWAYRVLDAQWVRTQRHPRAVPQRRRRVFVVGCLGDATSAAAVLFERESVQRNPAKGAKARQGAAADARSGAEGGGRQWPAEVTCTLNTMYSTKLGLEDQPALHGAPAFVLGEKPSVIWREGDQANAAHCVDFAGTLNCDKGQQGGIIAQPYAIAFKPGQSAAARTLGAQEEVACTLEAGGGGNNRQAVAHAQLREVAATIGQRMRGLDGRVREVTVAPTLPSTADNCCELPLVMQEAQAVPFRDPSPTLTAKMQGASGWAPYNEDAHLVGVPLVMQEPQPIAFHPTQEPISSVGVSHALGTGKTSGAASCAVATSLSVRRLTPRECERLQGFPDDYTAIAYRNKPAADGPRYKALGNSMAVNCMEWIGERIAAVDYATKVQP